MGNILVLDCTLRDGGYCNNWKFGENGIKKIITGLIASKAEVIECGFLTNKLKYNPDISKYTNIYQINNFIPPHGNTTKFVLMINYGEYNVDCLPDKSTTLIDGIRVAFHKKNRYDALEMCKKIKEKGYLVFIQPMVTMLYSEEEFVELVTLSNEIEPYAFYIVDSFGMMNRTSLKYYYRIVDNTLKDNIILGFHSHNNLQSAFSNAQILIESETKHNIIIDCSVYGMGRGAGNLNSELFMNELNEQFGKKYGLKPILNIMDEVINRFYEENPWGYSLPNYLSAVHMLHPNYAEYLSNKKTLKLEDMDEIFSMMDFEKGIEYDEKYIQELYIQYMSSGMTRDEHLLEIKKRTKNKKILLIAPGKNAIYEQDRICQFIRQNNPIIISINHEYPLYPSDYIFISNIRRFGNLNQQYYNKTISTSNIKCQNTYVSVDYFKLLNTVEGVCDNAGLMAIKFVIENLEVNELYIAGLDGYTHDIYANFETRDMAFMASDDYIDCINYGMRSVLKDYKKIITIKFITSSLLK